MQVDETRRVSLRVDQKSPWNLGQSNELNDNAYFQNGAAGDNGSSQSWKSVHIDNLKQGDRIILTTNPGKQCAIWSNNTDLTNNNNRYYFSAPNSNTESYVIEFTVTQDGYVTIQNVDQYAGIHKIEVWEEVPKPEPRFDYDPGYEEYDLWDEGSDGHPTSYELSGDAGFTLNGVTNTARYITLQNTGKTINNRIAVDPTAGTWGFKHGIIPPNTNGTWSNFSICNLKEGDRVVFSYTGYDEEDNIRISSIGGSDPFTNPVYNGCNAFFDKNNDGIFDEGEDTYITPGMQPIEDWSRGEGTILQADGREDNGEKYLHYTQAIVITEDGHLDIAIKNAVGSRIVKIKIYSDHQASMVDEYDAVSYTSKFDITGELQAKEHIVPGGLEVHVGSDDASQHAHVVRSGNGPVSIVNAVDGFKLPGMSRDSETGNLVFNFNLGKTNNQGNYDTGSVPTTGTFYKFMPLENGKMKITFQATSMNYYRYDLNGDDVYYNESGYYNRSDAWSEEFDRPNEQTVSGTCPYYLMKTTDGVNFTLVEEKDVENGDYDSFYVENALENETYYLFGGWNAEDLYFNYPGEGGNNLEYFTWGTTTNMNKACGVAKLLQVEYNPEKKIYPLAKWVPNNTTAVKDFNGEKIGVPNPDNFTMEYELADLYGYTDATQITVKKMSGNITQCHPFMQRVSGGTGHEDHFKLMIDGIEFVQGKDKGGTILIKIGDPSVKSNPVYTLTIAYSTDPTFDGNEGRGTRGYTWDFSSSSLNGFDWEPSADNAPTANTQGVFTNDLTVSSKYAQPVDYGHYFTNYLEADISNYGSVNDVLSSDQSNLKPSESGLLYKEIHAEEISHSDISDWKFNYNLVNAGKLFDPVFQNKFDLEGDNADLIWETEGTVFKTSANRSVMFNEFTGADIHQSPKDPDRYVGILEGGEFRIPWLMKNDRVIIYMGAGKGAFNDQVVFNIRGAYDAVHNEISESDDYIVGGSHWNSANSDNYYRGCYHFFAKGGPTVDGKTLPADMVFKMTGGNLCKIYKIQIYRGDRIITNEIVGKTEDDNKYFLWSRSADPNDNTGDAKGSDYNWSLKYFGKNQKLADGTNSQENEIIAKTGNINNALSTDAEANTFTYTHGTDEIGTFRMRGKDMEKNMKYVADYADHNVTVALQETMKYPYTWDFTDVTGIEDNVTNLFAPEEKLGDTDDAGNPPTESGVSKDVWNSIPETSYQKTARDLSLWEVSGSSGNYFLRLNSQTSQTLDNPMERDNIFESAKEIGGNQVWANETIVPEMQGLLFYTEYTDETNQTNLDNYQEIGEWTIKQSQDGNVGGLEFDGPNDFLKIVVPNVPKNAAVYLRMTKSLPSPAVKYKFGDDDLATISNSDTRKLYQVPGTTNDYIVALLNTNTSKSNLTLALNGYRIQKLAVSDDFKKVNKYGWATESRARVIDPSLTSELTGNTFKHYIVTGASFADSKVELTDIDDGVYMPEAEEDGNQAYIIRNMDLQDKMLDSNNQEVDNPEPGLVKILKVNGVWGFHLFVPDMNDYLESRPSGDYRRNKKSAQSITNNKLLARLNGDLSQKDEDDFYNYVLTTSTTSTGTGKIKDYDHVVFARVPSSGMKGGKNVGYLPVDCSDGSSGGAKMSIVFTSIDEPVGNVETAIETPSENVLGDKNAVYYNLNGQKIDGKPTKGIYVVNGKKIVVK